MKTVFDAIRGQCTSSYICQKCRRKKQKIVTVQMTVNPFNRKPCGTPRTPQEVFKAANEKAREEMDEFLVHPVCPKCRERDR